MSTKANGRTHSFHAEANILSGHLLLPLPQKIQTQSHAQLCAEGGYKAQHSTGYRLEGVLSYSAAHTQVAGHLSDKPELGWNTLTTTVIENLNVLEVLTADRVVGQIITTHPLEGYVPTISFLGTRFENLRVAGHPVELDLDLELCGEKPENDGPYSKEPGVLSRIGKQYDRIRAQQELPADLRDLYDQRSSALGSTETLEASLVNQAAGRYPGKSFGHIIHVPNFGKIELAKLTIAHEEFHLHTGAPKKTTVYLTMIHLHLGCVISGDIPIGNGSANGGPKG